jgi:DNA-binding transcriptional regulator LsrR (DeoR family)
MVSRDGSDGDSSDELALATRAAWLYHAGGLTQSQVAEKLAVPNARAHRLIARAVRAGLVRVLVDGPIGGCIEQEQALSARFDLTFCRVVPGLGENGLPLRALGAAAAAMLHDALQRDEHRIIGVGHGRTLGAAIDLLPRIAAPNVTFVSLLGGLTRRTGTSPFDVIHRLAEKTGAEAWLMPVPFFANTPSDRQVMLAQRGIAEAMQMAAQATLRLVGIGEVTDDAFLPSTGIVTGAEVQELLAAGAAGEVLGHYFDAAGRRIATPLHDRVIAVAPEAGSGRAFIAVAGGPGKTAAIRSVLRGGLLSGLITDEPTAARIIAGDPGRGITKKATGSETCTRRPRISAKPSSPADSAAGS